MQSTILFSDIMSEISDIYHALNSIDVSTSITHLFKTKQSNANQSNAIAITSNFFSSNAKFNLFNKNMRNFISSKRFSEIDLKTNIEICFQSYWKHNVYNHDLYFVMRDDFENFDIEIWKLVFTNFWSKIHKICYTQNVWINLLCATNEKRADCMTIAFVFEFYKKWIKKQILHVKKKYKKFSSIIQKQWKKMKKQTTKRKIIINAFISTFSNSDQRLENTIFIASTTVSKTNFEHITKRHIKQSFDNASPIQNSADQTKQNIEQSFDDVLSTYNLIDQSAKQNQKHLPAASNTISFVQDARDQELEFSSHQTTNRQSYKIHWGNHFDQNLRDVKNNSSI